MYIAPSRKIIFRSLLQIVMSVMISVIATGSHFAAAEESARVAEEFESLQEHLIRIEVSRAIETETPRTISGAFQEAYRDVAGDNE